MKACDRTLFEYLLRLGDDQLVLGQRLAEWLGHAPVLEEDVALANLSLDCLGCASQLLGLAGELEGRGRSADDLAFRREESAFRNCLLVEQPNGDFGATIARQFLYDAFAYHLFGTLEDCRSPDLAAIARRAEKEVTYHLRHGRDWLIRLGDGTDESRERMQSHLERLWPYTEELFAEDDVTRELVPLGLAADPADLKPRWELVVSQSLATATLTAPEGEMPLLRGGRSGRHTEYLGHLLAEMQALHRAHPEATW